MRHGFLAYRCTHIFVLATIFGTAFTNSAIAQVTQRSSLLLRDVGKVTLDASGRSQITYNPAICRRLGPELCEYFRQHEMGHVNLRHLERGVPTRQAEIEADRYAAAKASPAAVAAAKTFFANGNGGSAAHGTGRQRAARLSHPTTVARVSSRQPSSSEQRSNNGRTVQGRSAAPRKYFGGSKINRTRCIKVNVTPHVKQKKKVVGYARNGVRYQQITLAKR